ncbi:VOC family protein [Halomonas campisalis]|uniref:VOC family protein n=1 Tax=Billgrantia campisalis TaxID=74661 RepID=A0ABS9P702_9GAMM|nr:VOC family protein [Halomonas campisalis]MCG6657548.1 VOC family protein [Halomonas campisalis]MDR5862678.1 VOC family protein [Halomonas campisalis]
MEQCISLITLGVGDLARARRFYEEGLGWEVGMAVEGEVVFFQLNGLILSLFPRVALARDAGVGDKGSGFSGIALAHNVRSEPEVDSVLSEAERAGGRIVKPASRAEWGGYSGYFADPDGHLWEVAYNPGFPIDAKGNTRLG